MNTFTEHHNAAIDAVLSDRWDDAREHIGKCRELLPDAELEPLSSQTISIGISGDDVTISTLPTTPRERMSLSLDHMQRFVDYWSTA